jgi:putative transposase
VIDAEKTTYPIAMMCALLGISRSTFYAWRDRAETATTVRRRDLQTHVRRVFEACRGSSGCRRVTAAPNRQDIACRVGLVADVMRDLGRQARRPRASKRTTVPGELPVSTPDLIDRDFTAALPGTRLVGDLTYLGTTEGGLYLATVIDSATRMVVGRQTAQYLRPSLIIAALDMAKKHGHVSRNAVFHSDRGGDTPPQNSPGSASVSACAPTSGGPASAGTTPPLNHSSPP